MDPATFATAALNALAAAAAIGHAAVLARKPDRTPLEARFMSVTAALGILACVRALDEVSPVALQRLEDVVAALAPLGLLVLAEGALRRHAPQPAKWLALAGSAVFAIAAVIRPDGAGTAFAMLFAAYLLGMVGVVAWLIARRSRNELSSAENRVIGGLGLVLIISAPLAMTDFAAIAPDPPIRLGALAILMMVYAAVRLAEPDADAAELARDAGLVIGLGIGGGLASGGLFPGASLDDMVRTGCLLAGGVLATLALWRTQARDGLQDEGWLALAGAGLHMGRDGFAAELLTTPRFADVRIFAADALADYEPVLLAALFQDRLVLTMEDLDAPEPGSPQDALRALLEATSVTHAAALSLSPLSLAMVNAGGLADRRAWTARLAVVARLSRALPEREPDEAH